MLIHCDESIFDVLLGIGRVYNLFNHPGNGGILVASTQFGAVSVTELATEGVLRGFKVVTEWNGVHGSIRFERGMRNEERL